MQYSNIITVAAALFTAGTAVAQNSAQVNLYAHLLVFVRSRNGSKETDRCRSYYDKECQSYAGHRYPSSGTVTGGPAGSQAIIWVDAGGPYCCDGKPVVVLISHSSMIKQLLTFTVSGYLRACKNSECNAYDDVSIGQCKSFDNGVWAEWFCIDCGGK